MNQNFYFTILLLFTFLFFFMYFIHCVWLKVKHLESQPEWLLPPCRTRVVSPIIDLIDWRSFQYNATQWPVRGVFDWRLDFHWDSSGLQPQEEESGSAVEALR